MSTNTSSTVDELYVKLREEALTVLKDEPELCTLLHRTVLESSVRSFEDAVACTVCYRLLLHPFCQGKLTTAPPMFCPNALLGLVKETMVCEALEGGWTMSEAIREDALAVLRRDPATDTLLEVVLFSKGYAALVCHRVAYRLWNRKKFTALFLQSQASAVFGLDLHPRAQIGARVMLDHGTGVVIGETAVVGDGVTLMHGVTLGGTGKDHGDRHPKIGNNVLIGAGSSILGNIRIGDGAKIGAGSVVLREIPSHATAVGIPAKIIGRATESQPGSDVDETLESVSLLHKSQSVRDLTSSSTPSLTSTIGSETEEEEDTSNGGTMIDGRCPFREYYRQAKNAPPNTITICTLRHLLLPEGCTLPEIGKCFFALDTRDVGYVYKDAFRSNAVDVIVCHTELNKERADAIVTSYLATALDKEHAKDKNNHNHAATPSVIMA